MRLRRRTPAQREHHRRQNRWVQTYGRGKYPRRRWRWVIFIGLALFFLAGCNQVIVTDRFPDGSPREAEEYDGTHWDYDNVTPYDQWCGAVDGIFCPGWNSPERHGWTHVTYHDYIGAQGYGYWITSDGGWWNFANCELTMIDYDQACKGLGVTAPRG